MKQRADKESCYYCKYLDYIEDTDSDGHVLNSGDICTKRHGVYNLKHFPFRNKQGCFEKRRVKGND